MFEVFHHLRRVDSTNDFLKRFRSLGRPSVALALYQKRGKGRHGRAWDSPAGQGLYVSYLLYPDCSVEESVYLNRVATGAVVRALARVPGAGRLALEVKEPNDVLAGGRKICGVLVELASRASKVEWAIIGIGVNLRHREFELRQGGTPATSLLLEGVEPPAPAELCAILTAELAGLLAAEKTT